MDVLAKPQGREKTVHFRFTPETTSGNEVLKVHDATVGYVEPIEPMAGPINFQVNKGDRIAIIGQNGVGKSTLLKSVLRPDSIFERPSAIRHQRHHWVLRSGPASIALEQIGA
jgi:ATPase subunit of ABC transporter with duplicated ATPase domains